MDIHTYDYTLTPSIYRSSWYLGGSKQCLWHDFWKCGAFAVPAYIALL